jgi:hypothetical protein
MVYRRKGFAWARIRIRSALDCAATRVAHPIAIVPATLPKEGVVLSGVDTICWFIK